MWTLPGYGDHLEATHPGLREQVAEVGGPEGFEDVVASINPIPEDEPDTPPHWSVTFATDDADATAAKASELGGKVIAAAVRRSLGADDGDPRPAGSDPDRQQVRAREPGLSARRRPQLQAHAMSRLPGGTATGSPGPDGRRRGRGAELQM